MAFAVLVHSHTDTSGSGGLTIGDHVIDRADLPTYETQILAGDITIPFEINQFKGLNQRLNQLAYELYTSDLDIIDLISAGSGNFADGEVPSGTMNGINATFTLAQTPISGSVHLYLQGIRMKLGQDYTISGATITMINIPKAGKNFIADYRY